MSDLLEELRRATRALAGLADPAGEVWPRVSAALSAMSGDVERRLASTELKVLVSTSNHAAARLLIDTAIGEPLLPPDRPGPGVTLLVRHAKATRYVVILADGTPLDFMTSMPDREPFLREALAERERRVSDAATQLQDLERSIASRDAARARAIEPTIQLQRGGLRRRAVVALRRWLEAMIALIVALVGRKPPVIAQRSDAQRVFDREISEAEERLDAARRAADQMRIDLTKHVAERRAAFDQELAALSDPQATDRSAIEILIEHPCALLPAGLVLVFSPGPAPGEGDEVRKAAWAHARENLGGRIVLSRPADEASEVVVPHVLAGPREGATEPERRAWANDLRRELPSLFQRLRYESPSVVGALAALDVTRRLESLAAGSTKAEGVCRARVLDLERSRVPEPARFREERMAAVGSLVDEAAQRVIAHAVGLLQTRLGDPDDAWTRAIEACSDRAHLDACMVAMDEAIPDVLARIGDRVMEDVAARMNKEAEMLQVWVLDALTVAYRVQGSAEDAAPLVLTDLSGEASATREVLLAPTRIAFERKRVGLGLGGAAAGAALGTIVLPGIGTAVGAFIGVLAGFVEGTDALKRRSIEALRAHLRRVHHELVSRLEEGRGSLVRDLTSAMEETLIGALERRGPDIAALIAAQEKAIARERQLLDELSGLRAALDRQCRHFATLAEAATRAVRELATTRATIASPAAE